MANTEGWNELLTLHNQQLWSSLLLPTEINEGSVEQNTREDKSWGAQCTPVSMEKIHPKEFRAHWSVTPGLSATKSIILFLGEIHIPTAHDETVYKNKRMQIYTNTNTQTHTHQNNMYIYTHAVIMVADVKSQNRVTSQHHKLCMSDMRWLFQGGGEPSQTLRRCVLMLVS